MTSKFSRTLCALSAAAVVWATTPAVYASAAYTKDEVVYVNLLHDGSVDAVYVVNSFDIAAGGTLTDRGDYSEVINLTNTEKIKQSGQVLSVHAEGGRFYYEGVLGKRDIPWVLSVRYSLDGMPISGADLAGKSGRLEIAVGIRQKEDTNAVWRENYAIQASLSLGSETCTHITAPDATIASVGDQKQLSYIILPGKDKDFTITADVVDFEMDGISFNMIPLALTIDSPDTTEIKDRLYELRDGAVELDDGARELDDGVDKLDSGAVRLRDGVIELVDGVDELRDGADDLRDGTSDLLKGTRDIRKGSEKLISGARELQSGASTFSNGLSALNSQSPVLAAGSAQMKAELEKLAGAVAGITAEGSAVTQQQAVQLGKASQDYLTQLNKLIGDYENLLAALGQSGRAMMEPYDEAPAEIITQKPDENLPADLPGEQPDLQPDDDDDANLPDTDPPADEGAGTDTETPAPTVQEFVAPMSTGFETYGAYEDQILYLQLTLDMLRTMRDSYIGINTGVQQMTGAVSQQAATLPAMAEGIRALDAQYVQIHEGIAGYTAGVGQLQANFGALTGGLETLSDGIDDLHDGAGELREGAKELHNGTYDLQDGVRKLTDGTVELSDGVTELGDGTTELRDGTLELIDGTRELRDETADMDAEIDDKIDELLAEYNSKVFTPVSFVDASNPNIGAVQFVMKTADIAVEDAAEIIAEAAPEPTTWQRFINLFAFLRQDS